MFAKVNVGKVINTHNVGYLEVHNGAGDEKGKPWVADFYNATGKVITRSYGFEKESECWDFVKQVISDGSRRDMLSFAALDKNQPAV